MLKVLGAGKKTFLSARDHLLVCQLISQLLEIIYLFVSKIPGASSQTAEPLTRMDTGCALCPCLLPSLRCHHHGSCCCPLSPRAEVGPQPPDVTMEDACTPSSLPCSIAPMSLNGHLGPEEVVPMKCSFLLCSSSRGHLSSPREPEATAMSSCKGPCSSVKHCLNILEVRIWGRRGCFLLNHGL